MKKLRAILLVLFIFCSFVLIGCGPTAQNSTTDNSQDEPTINAPQVIIPAEYQQVLNSIENTLIDKGYYSNAVSEIKGVAELKYENETVYMSLSKEYLILSADELECLPEFKNDETLSDTFKLEIQDVSENIVFIISKA